MKLTIKEIALIKQDPLKYIEKELTKSYSHKPHLASLPHDRRTNDLDKLQERLDEINRRVKEVDESIDKDKKELETLTKRLRNRKIERQNNTKKIKHNEESFDEEIQEDYNRWKEFKEGYDKGFYTQSWWSENFTEYVHNTINKLDERIENIKNVKYDTITEKEKKDLISLWEDEWDFMKEVYDNDDETEHIYTDYGHIFQNPAMTLRDVPELKEQNNELTKEINNIENSIQELENNQKQQANIRQDYIEEKKKTEDKMKDIKS